MDEKLRRVSSSTKMIQESYDVSLREPIIDSDFGAWFWSKNDMFVVRPEELPQHSGTSW